MSEWITDRRPTKEDGIEGTVLAWRDGKCILAPWDYASYADLPWKPIPKCEPYVKPQRCLVLYHMDGSGLYRVTAKGRGTLACYIPTHEAAQRIAAIYEEAMP